MAAVALSGQDATVLEDIYETVPTAGPPEKLLLDDERALQAIPMKPIFYDLAFDFVEASAIGGSGDGGAPEEGAGQVPPAAGRGREGGAGGSFLRSFWGR